MMINCPKCGFSQPDDQYCASCGIDMKSFRPVPKSMWSKIASNTFIQVASLVIIVSIGYSYVRYQKQQDLSRRIAEIEANRQMSEIEQSSARQKSNEASARALAKRQADAASVATPQVNANTAAAPVQPAQALVETHQGAEASVAAVPAVAAPAAAPVAAQPAVAGRGNTPQMNLLFASASPAYIGDLMHDARDVTSVGSASVGVISQIESKIQAGKTDRSLLDMDAAESGTLHPLSINQPVIVFKGVHDQVSGQNVGLTVQVIAMPSTDPTSSQVQVDVLRVLRDTNGNPPIEEFSVQLPDPFTVPRGSGLLIAGVLPRRDIAEIDEKLYRTINILRILTTEAFKTGNVDLAIFVQIK